MKTIKKIRKVIVVIVLLVAACGVKSQTPTYICEAKNDTLLNSNIYQFDVYIYEAAGSPAELWLNNYMLGFNMGNNMITRNGGTMAASIVPGSSQLPSAFQPKSLNIQNNQNAVAQIRVNGPSASINGTKIPGTGLRICTVRLTNPAGWGLTTMNLTPNNSSPYKTTVNAIVPADTTGPLVDITIFPGSHTTNFTNPMLNAEVTAENMTGGGEDCSGGVVVGIDNSEVGVMYKLMKGATQVDADVPGTGSAISFGSQLAGIYTCNAYRKATFMTATMAGNAVVTKLVPSLNAYNFNFNRAVLHWTNFCPGATQYHVYWRNQAEINSLGALYATVSSPIDTLLIQGLQAGAIYYWKVAPDYGNGWEAYSDSVSFVTPVPTMWVTDITYNRAILRWSGINGAVNYNIKYVTGSITKYRTTNVDTLAINNLSPSSNYSWQIAPDYGDGFGFTTLTKLTVPGSSFTTGIAPAPTLTANPVNFNHAVLSWTPTPGAIKYAVKCFYNNPAINTVPCWTLFPTPGNTSDTIKTLIPGHTYFWEVAPDYGFGWTSFSPLSTFTTPTPVLTAENLSFNREKVYWSGITGAIRYAVRYDKSGVPTVKYTTVDTLILNSLTAGTLYGWQVIPDYGYGYTSYTPSSYFTTSTPSLWVENLNFNQVKAKWSGITGAIRYAVRYYEGGFGFGVPIVRYALTADSSLILTSLTQGTSYDWQVNPSYDGLTYTSYSQLSNFITPTPVLIVNSTTTTTANLSWSGINGATGFAVKYRKDGTTPYVTKYTGGPASITLTGLSSSTLYDWAVNPNYGSGYTSYTLNSNFTTTAVKLINPLLSVTEDMATLSIYPNPATDMVAINFSSKTKGESNIRVFDIAGNAVIGKTIPTIEGNNTFILNLNNLSSGMYLLELANGDKVKTKKIIVQR